MTDDKRNDLRHGIEEVVRAAALDTTDVLHGYDRKDAVYMTVPPTPAVRHEWRVWVSRLDSDATTPDLPPLDTGQLLGLAALLKDEGMTPQVLADYLIDAGHEYATAVAEKAAKEERERIAARLYREAAHALSRPGDQDVNALVSAALSSVADDLTFGVPPTAPE